MTGRLIAVLPVILALLTHPLFGQEPVQDAAVYEILPEQSRIFIRVGRAGLMKAAGHDHVVTSEAIEGIVLVSDDPALSRADLRIALQELIVDRAEDRERFRLKPEVSESSIAGTKENMHKHVLVTDAFPVADVSARFSGGDESTLVVSITLKETTSNYIVPVDLIIESDTLRISGSMSITHEGLGLKPFRAVGGLLRVAEELQIEFEIVATRSVEDQNS